MLSGSHLHVGLELSESSSPGVENSEIVVLLNPDASSSKTALTACSAGRIERLKD